jgi:hypothetical protein
MSIKHFENLWEESEALGIEAGQLDLIGSKVSDDVKIITEALAANNFGQALFHLCGISAKLNINSYAALEEYNQEMKQKILEAQEEE